MTGLTQCAVVMSEYSIYLLICGLFIVKLLNNQLFVFRATRALSFRITPMATRIADLLHKGLVTSLLGITVVGIASMWSVHQDTLKRGRGTC